MHLYWGMMIYETSGSGQGGHADNTEETCVSWIKQYTLFHGKRHPYELGEADVSKFLTYLAVNRNVAASTQNQVIAQAILVLESKDYVARDGRYGRRLRFLKKKDVEVAGGVGLKVPVVGSIAAGLLVLDPVLFRRSHGEAVLPENRRNRASA